MQNLDRFKLRCYDKKINKINNCHLDWVVGSILFATKHGTDQLLTPERARKSVLLPNKDIILMQSTALKDKNDSLIYEGDIIKVKLDNPKEILNSKQLYLPNCEQFYLYKIEYQENGSWFRVCGINADHHMVLDFDFIKDSEIVGNIYENSELLNNNL